MRRGCCKSELPGVFRHPPNAVSVTTSLLFRPVFSGEAGNMAELTHIVGHQRQPPNPRNLVKPPEGLQNRLTHWEIWDIFFVKESINTPARFATIKT